MMTNAGGEEALVIRGRSGDRAAFEELVRRTARGLFTRLYLDTADVHRAEDLVQETYLRAWKRMGSISDPKTFRAWLLAIAHGVLVDSIKHDGRKKRETARTGSSEQAMSLVADNGASPAELTELDERRRAMLATLNSLPPEYRDVLALRYLAGADYREISKQLAISNGSLRGLLSRGMKMLREKMEM